MLSAQVWSLWWSLGSLIHAVVDRHPTEAAELDIEAGLSAKIRPSQLQIWKFRAFSALKASLKACFW